LHFGLKTLALHLLHKLELILSCKEGSPSAKNGYGHTSAEQRSAVQSCHRYENNTKSETSVFTHLCGMSRCFLLRFG
jgi:hypothetical protein